MPPVVLFKRYGLAHIRFEHAVVSRAVSWPTGIDGDTRSMYQHFFLSSMYPCSTIRAGWFSRGIDAYIHRKPRLEVGSWFFLFQPHVVV